MKEIFDQVTQIVPNLIGALLILVIGWLAAFAVSNLVRKSIKSADLDSKVARWVGREEEKAAPEVGRWVGTGVFYLLIFFVLVAFFQTLGLTSITEPLNQLLNKIFAYAPRLIGPAILLLAAWIIASILRFALLKVLGAAKLDERLSAGVGIEEEERRIPIAKSVSDVVYWLVGSCFCSSCQQC